MSHPSPSAPPAQPPATRPGQGLAVDIRRLRKGYGGAAVLDGIDLAIRAGEVFVIMGPSGAGKSVLLRHLIGLESADAGEILIDGQPAGDEVRARFRLAMVFQSGGLLNSLTVAENVGLFLSEHRVHPPERIAAIVREKLDLVHLEPAAADRFPAELSGGMRKRAAIARALTVDPQLVLYDEPTSELDPVVARTIGREISALNRRTGATTVVVTHDRDLAFALADRIGFLSGGRLTQVGTPEEIRASRDPLITEFLNAEPYPA